MTLFDAQKLRFEQPDFPRTAFPPLLLALKLLRAPFHLRVRRIFYLDPRRGSRVRQVRPKLPLCDHAFEVVLAGKVEDLRSVLLDVIAVEHTRGSRWHHAAQDLLALDQW